MRGGYRQDILEVERSSVRQRGSYVKSTADNRSDGRRRLLADRAEASHLAPSSRNTSQEQTEDGNQQEDAVRDEDAVRIGPA